MGRGGATGKAEQMISHVCGDVDFSGRAGDDVNLHKLFPERANTVVVVAAAGFGVEHELSVEGGVALSVEGELQGFHAVVLGQVGHEGAQGPWWLGDIEEDLGEGGGS